VADTGTGSVDVFDGHGGPNFPEAGFHQLWGNAGTYTNPNPPGNTFTSVLFKSPYAVACDASDNLWVTDTGYSPSYVEEFSSATSSYGVSIINAFQTIPGCVATGIAVPPATSIYKNFICVADSGNNQVEIYTQTGQIVGILADPLSYYEGGKKFQPSCIGFDAQTPSSMWVADTANDNLISFKPQ
jgi:hypothetical protein